MVATESAQLWNWESLAVHFTENWMSSAYRSHNIINIARKDGKRLKNSVDGVLIP